MTVLAARRCSRPKSLVSSVSHPEEWPKMIIVNNVASIVPSLSSISCRKHLSALLRSSRERDACGKLKFPRYPAAKLCRVWVAARDWVKVLSMEKERGLESLTKLHKMR